MSSYNFKCYLESKESQCYFVTTAVGGTYLEDWKAHALPLLMKYARKHGLGIIAITGNLISEEDSFFRNAAWQKLIALKYLIGQGVKIKRFCLIDTDVLVNPFSPNLFDFVDESNVGVVSQFKNLPYEDLGHLKRKVAFYRNRYYSEDYPLDSSLHMTLEQMWEFLPYSGQNDYFCSGLVVGNASNHGELFNQWYYEYQKSEKDLDDWEEAYLNYQIQKNCEVTWLDYKFQTLWLFEMAAKYEFLYRKIKNSKKDLRNCIESSLSNCYFLHFAGSWYEGKMWKSCTVIDTKKENELDLFYSYCKQNLQAKPLGKIIPK